MANGYVYDEETKLYYLQSRYYDPEIGRFLNADTFVSTGQGFTGYNMFAYCNNNPVNYADSNGMSTDSLLWWTTGMAWMPYADAALPIGDLIYIGGILLLCAAVLAVEEDSVPKVTYVHTKIGFGPPSPNDDDDDDDYYDDDYYDDDSNFGGRQKIGKPKGNAPGNNQAQNSVL